MSSYSINYIKNDGTEYDLPLEEWQMKAIVKFLGLMLYEDEDGSARYVYMPVIPLLNIMGTPCINHKKGDIYPYISLFLFF